ncbi:L,D-transpeptidase [Streptomyces sp. R-07]|uniref:L,D-transpeptidase n=1 Tax=Streptomyces sp. R-07 TaxID=3404052 RepID=UPI003CFAF794
MNRLTSAALTGVLLAGGAMAVAPATQAAPAPAGVGAAAAPAVANAAAGKTSQYYFLFDKNWSDPTKSRLYYMKSRPGKDQKIGDFRAGSGNGSTRECAKNAGWLPTGTYNVGIQTKRKAGGPKGINGYAIPLSNKWCKPQGKERKVVRDALFIHSEMLSNGKQDRQTKGDNPYRWDGPGDYYSLGCTKLSPKDIQALFRLADKHGWPKQLKVVN